MLDRVVDIETQFLEIRDDHILRILMLALVAEGLPLYVTQIGRLMVFQFNDSDHLLISQYSTICFLGIGLILLLSDEVEVR